MHLSIYCHYLNRRIERNRENVFVDTHCFVIFHNYMYMLKLKNIYSLLFISNNLSLFHAFFHKNINQKIAVQIQTQRRKATKS